MKIDRKLKQKYINKRVNAKKENIDFNLSLEDFIRLLDEANISYNDIGNRGYHLARKNDIGPYKIGNCNFITYKENLAQKKISLPTEKSREASRKNIQKALEKLKNLPKEKQDEILQKAKIGREISRANFGHPTELKQSEIENRLQKIASIPKEWGWKVKAGKVLNMTPQAVGRFYKKYGK